MQRLGGGGYTRKNKRGGGNDPSCGCDMQAGWPKFLTDNIPLPTMKGGSCGIPPIPNYYQGGGMNQRGGSCPCSGGVVPTPFQSGGGQPTVYNSNPVPDACPFPGTGYCGFYARGGAWKTRKGGANYGEPMYLQARLRGGSRFNYETDMEYQNMNEYSQSLMRRGYNEMQQKENERKRLAEQKAKEKALENLKKQSPVQATSGPAVKPKNSGAIQQQGAGCGCSAWKGGSRVTTDQRGGYKPTKKNLNALKRWKRGESIGFTQTASLKAKGLIPRTSRKHRGKKVVSAKYK